MQRRAARFLSSVRLLPPALEERLAAKPPVAVNHTIAIGGRDGAPRLLNLLIFRTSADGPVAAFENYCPHQGGPLWIPPVGEDAATLVCKAHGATFRPGDGLCLSGPCAGQRLNALAVSECGESGGTTTTVEALEALRDNGSGGRKPPAGWQPSPAVTALLERFAVDGRHR